MGVDSKPVEKAVEKAKPAADPVLFGSINTNKMNQALSRLRGPPSFSKKQRVESKPPEKAAEEAKPKEVSDPTGLKKQAENAPVEAKTTEAADPQKVAKPRGESKLKSRVDDLQPGEWFKKQSREWQASVTSWKSRQGQWKNPAQKNVLLAKLADKKAADGEEALKEIDAEEIDVCSVEDVMDIGSGEPLFANFEFEDWALLSVRFELHLLVHAFRKDVDDPARTVFHESHFPFYYNKYFQKQWSNQAYGVDTLKAVCNLVKEVISLTDDGVVKALLSEDAAEKNFVHLTEEHRRDRERLFDAGMESAVLKFPRQPEAAKRPLAAAGGLLSVQPASKQAKIQPKPGGVQPKRGSVPWGPR